MTVKMLRDFADLDRNTLKASEINIGDKVRDMNIALTHTLVASTAIASMDYMPVHHDKDYALAQFAPDAFLNILSTNGYISRFITDWAGPETWVRKINVKLGVPAVPNQTLKFTGEVLNKTEEGDECIIEVSVTAANDSGNHATGTAEISIPL
jgi:acyl dehydratase